MTSEGIRTYFESACVFYASSAVVFLGVLFGNGFVKRCNDHPGSNRPNGFLSACTAWDGQWYCDIVENGYSYQPGKMCNAAFFPGLPCIAAIVKRAAGCSTEVALLSVANLCALLSAIVLREYVAIRFPDHNKDFHLSVVMICFFFPTTFFFRMAYTESLFVLIVLTFLFGIERKWCLVTLSLIAGCATATKTVGVSLLLPVMLVAWERSQTPKKFIGCVLCFAPLAIWGLIAFVVFQWIYLDEPLAFLKAQKAWEFRVVPTLSERFCELICLKPIWATYFNVDPSIYWGSGAPRETPEFSLQFMNPIFWMLAVVSVVYGFKSGFVSRSEATASFGLLLIPYCLQGPRAGMTSCARYASIVIPMYIVLAVWISRLPLWYQNGFLSLCAVFLFIYASMFSQWYWVF